MSTDYTIDENNADYHGLLTLTKYVLREAHELDDVWDKQQETLASLKRIASKLHILAELGMQLDKIEIPLASLEVVADMQRHLLRLICEEIDDALTQLTIASNEESKAFTIALDTLRTRILYHTHTYDQMYDDDDPWKIKV